MVSITLSVSEDTRNLMKRFPEVNWSAFVRKTIEDKARNLVLKDELLRKFEDEKSFNEWSVEIGREFKKKRVSKLKKDRII
ncbi:MAG: hypothetical protein AABX48_01420 [Nanoarchaeota archaeon]